MDPEVAGARPPRTLYDYEIGRSAAEPKQCGKNRNVRRGGGSQSILVIVATP